LFCFLEVEFNKKDIMTKLFGLDIGSDTIKVVQLEKEGNSFHLVAAGIVKTPVENLSFEIDKDIVTVAEAIKRLKNEAKIKTKAVVTALSEKDIFTQLIEMPKMKEEELEQAIPWEAENLIPNPISEVNLDWEIIEDEESAKQNKIKVFLVAAPLDLIENYLRVLNLADLQPVSLETELLATSRCLKPIFGEGNFLIGQIGVKSLDIAIISRGNPFLTSRLPTAGEAITRAVSSSLSLDIQTAEEYKKTYGLSSELEGKVAGAVEPILAGITSEIKKAIRFYEEKGGPPLKSMVISGGTALLPGMVEYLAKSLGLEVQIADPFSIIAVTQPSLQSFKSISPLFTVACGLAMKEG